MQKYILKKCILTPLFSSSSMKVKTDYKSVICKSRDYNFFKKRVESTHEYILEFYIDRNFEFNSVWEGIYTTI